MEKMNGREREKEKIGAEATTTRTRFLKYENLIKQIQYGYVEQKYIIKQNMLM